MTGVTSDSILVFYRFLQAAYVFDMQTKEAELQTKEAQLAEIAQQRDEFKQEAADWKGYFITLHNQSKRLEELQGAQLLAAGTPIKNCPVKQHEPPIFKGEQKLELVQAFIEKVEHYVCIRGTELSANTERDDKLMDTVWRFFGGRVYEWFQAWLTARPGNAGHTIPPPNGRYLTTWKDFQEAFRLRVVPEVAVTLVRKELGDMKFKRRDNVLRFNDRYAELLGMLSLKTYITRNDALYDAYVAKFPEALQAQIVASARMQKKLVTTSPFTLADAMELVAEAYAEGGTGSTSVRQTVNTAVPRPLIDTGGPQPMDLSLTKSNSITCFRCKGIGHMVKDCPSPDTRERTAQ
jgi:hypothetical protein